MTDIMKRRALLSVYDKTGIVDLGRALSERGWEILSTGGTARTLREAGVEVTDVSEATGHPEMMEGRVKTLHPAIHAGLLARRDHVEDLEALEAQGYAPIDLVAVNLYPFRQTVVKPDVTFDQAMGQVDIGGPTMIRSAAKNHTDVWVVVDPDDYDEVVGALEEVSGRALRQTLAAKVFAHVSDYDAAVATYLADQGQDDADGGDVSMPETRTVELERIEVLRYGENPGQDAAFYRLAGSREGLAGLEQLHGKALSYNNLLDLDGALLSLAPFAFADQPAVCIVKHTTPCGLAVADTQVDAYRRALRTDPVSAFGSVIALNRSADEETAAAISELFVECVVAPAFSPEALEMLRQKKNIRLVTYVNGDVEKVSATERFLAGHGRLPEALALRSVYGGMLAQTPAVPPFYDCVGEDWTDATERTPEDAEMDDLKFAWAAVFGVKSNAILLARDGATLGIGAGQMSRVDSSRIAVRKAADAGLDLDGCVLASDAFFPFRDGVDAAAEAGVKAIVQPGGSIRDDEVVAAANEHGIAMVFTGRRLFRH